VQGVGASAARPAAEGAGRVRSSRVGRFGPRSLGFRLLIVLLVPIVGLQVFAFREVRRQQESADAAAEVSRQVQLLRDAGSLVAPLYLEVTGTHATVQAEAMGIDRTELASRTGVDFSGYVQAARTDLDAALADLVTRDGDLFLADGQQLATHAAESRTSLAAMRTDFDRGGMTMARVNAGFIAITGLLDEVHATAALRLAGSATTTELARIAGETDQLFSMLGYAARELDAIADHGIAGDATGSVAESVEAAGSFAAAERQLRRSLDPARLADFDALTKSPDFVRVDTALEQYIDTLTHPKVVGPGETPQVITPLMVDLFTSSVNRLRTLQTYANEFFDAQAIRADAIQHDAAVTRREAIVVMVISIVLSLVLLVLVMRSILRPLSHLVRKSRQVSSGDLAVATERPSGPTDIRVVTGAFNEMVTTLNAYEVQVRRLARGDTKVDPNLPGPLGDTLRQSVSHLAEVTSQLHASEAAAVMQARTDALTGLANRTSALEDLAVIVMQARTTGDTGAIVFLDLDGFKSVNDTQGHAEGDRILVEIAIRLRAACPDHLIARIGGDEFIIVIQHARSIDEVVELAGTLITVVSAPVEGSGGQLFTLSASAGVALVDGTRDPLGALAQADSAVYHAKERGRGRVEVFDERLAEVIEERADMALSMRHGIAAQEFALKLQPIIDVATKQPIGAEVLLRWNRPGVGEVGPTEFIPIAERTGVIVDLETWVLEQVVNIMREWRLHPTTARMRLAVNISGRHIVDGNLASLLEGLCERASVDPSLLDLEITETHLVADIGRAQAVVDELRVQGVRVAIDDFGTGYSSMTYLHQLTVDTLKIDRVFVSGMIDDRLDRTIVELLLRLGDSLGMNVIAEGVDSEAKLALLKELNCPWAQGFYIAKPMGIAEATQWLRQQEALASSLA
jgi:diguanylate cyclase (GGDEF)-like protein